MSLLKEKTVLLTTESSLKSSEPVHFIEVTYRSTKNSVTAASPCEGDGAGNLGTTGQPEGSSRHSLPPLGSLSYPV